MLNILESNLPVQLKIINICIFVLTLAISLSIHEFMHGWTAYKCGDMTAKEQGRLSFNPLTHLDPVGTILLLFAGFGWAKPVIINPSKMNRFKNKDISLRIVSLAGVTANFVLACVSFFLLTVVTIICYYQGPDLQGFQFNYFSHRGSYFLSSSNEPMTTIFISILCAFLYSLFERNLALMAFNLLPVPPLDGYHFLETILPRSVRYKLQSMTRYISLIFLVLMFMGFLGVFMNYIKMPFQYIIERPIVAIERNFFPEFDLWKNNIKEIADTWFLRS